MSKLKAAMFAGGLAFVVNNLCVLLLMGGGFIDQWLFVRPFIDLAFKIEPTWLGIVAFYMLGFLQFFIIFWVVLIFVFPLKKKRPPMI